MSKIKLTYRDLNAPYKCESYLDSLHSIICDLTDARRYFCSEELQESKKQFIADMMDGKKKHYISFIEEQIDEMKPAGLHGVYNLSLIREYEKVLDMIKNF